MRSRRRAAAAMRQRRRTVTATVLTDDVDQCPHESGPSYNQGCPDEEAEGYIEAFINCVSEGRGTASALDHAACAFMSIAVGAAVGGSIVVSGGTAAPGWVAAGGILLGAAASVTYGAICYCVLHAGP